MFNCYGSSSDDSVHSINEFCYDFSTDWLTIGEVLYSPARCLSDCDRGCVRTCAKKCKLGKKCCANTTALQMTLGTQNVPL